MSHATAVLALLLSVSAHAANSPLRINFQGRLTDPASNEPRNGQHSMTFRIYGAQTGGSALYTETQSAVQVDNGVFSVQIGSITALSPDLFTGASAYLSVQVSPDSEMSPRQALAMSPYALSAAQLAGDTAVRVRVGAVAYSTFTSAGNLVVAYGVTGTTGTFTATGNSIFSVTASSGILSSAGTLRSQGPGGVHADYGVVGGSLTATSHFDARTPGVTPSTAPAGSARTYYDSTQDAYLLSVNARANSPLGGMTVTMWNTNQTAAVANQGQNLPAALTELDTATQGTRQYVDCDSLAGQLAVRYNFRALAATSLTINISIRDVTNTANILATAGQAVNATQNWIGQGSFSAKPAWCTGTQTVAVYTDGGNGAWDAIFKHVILVGKP